MGLPVSRQKRPLRAGGIEWAARFGFVIWGAALAVLPAIVPEGGSPYLPSLPSRGAWGLAAVAGSAARILALRFLAFVPLGFLATYAFPPRAGRMERLLRVTLPALGLSGGSAVLVSGFTRDGAWSRPGLLALIPPVAGVLVGLWFGAAWRRGPRARFWILPKLTLAVAMAAALGLVLGRRSLETIPLPIDVPRLTTADRQHLATLFRGKNPEKIPAGATRTLRLSEDDINRLLAAGLTLTGEGRAARVELSPDHVRAAASVALPFSAIAPRFLNLTAGGRIRVDDTVGVDLSELSIGALSAPRWLLHLASPLVPAVLRDEPRVAPVLKAVKTVRVEDGAVEIEYGHATLPRGYLREMFREAAGTQDLVPAVQAQADHLVRLADDLPRSDERFGAALKAAFALARERSVAGDPVEENRAALITLGAFLGHWRVESLVGSPLDDSTRKSGLRAYRGTTLRGRRDWAQHYTVSAALSAIADATASDAAGLLKEEIDSRGGSGFSFADLLADRAGTTLGEVATRDASAARAIQDHLARDFRVDDFFPEAEDLPEHLTEAELTTRFGGVGGERYRHVVAIIEDRVASCPAYRY